ncbi:hypothetical protein GCM10027429_06140 [Marivirga atlantica]|uniref:Uncharacterized protein n=1 Tax=Marivirga atlantica TaxID=1548457 RepID=A0A937DIV9_9BACT|nr:hypothetical protein [Marivirga atlantica]MBL0764224.1 hypothetical protein [Marivirga atlantica]
MSFFDAVYNKLFKKHEPNTVLSHKALKRSEKERVSFKDWLQDDVSSTLLEKIHKAYHLKRTDIEGEIPILLFRSVYANGFAIKNNIEVSDRDFHFLLDYFKHKLLALGYRQAGSDSKVTAKDGFVLTVDKFYMKPPLQVEPPIDQLYGNIAIELHLMDDKPNYLKLMASIYSDRMYKEHQDFDELVELLLIKDAL